MFSKLFAINSVDLLQEVCKRLEQIHHGNTGERPERCHEGPDSCAGSLSAHFLSALPETQKCVKPIHFAYPDLDLEKSLHLRLSYRSPTIVADDPGSHRRESAPILVF